MGKGKKGGKRMNKAQLTEMLQEFLPKDRAKRSALKRYSVPSVLRRIRSRCWRLTLWRKWHGMTTWLR